MKEEWREIYGTDGNYAISNKGRVRSEFRQGANGGILRWRVQVKKGSPRCVIVHKGEHREYTQRELMKCYWPQFYFKRKKV